MSSPAKRGRPKGSPNIATIVDVEIPRCPKCGSTNRAKYTNPVELAYGGTTDSGKPYTHVIRRRTHCTDCGQWRVDRSYENREAAKE